MAGNGVGRWRGCAVVTLLLVCYFAGGGGCDAGVKTETMVTKWWLKVAGVKVCQLHRGRERESGSSPVFFREREVSKREKNAGRCRNKINENVFF